MLLCTDVSITFQSISNQLVPGKEQNDAKQIGHKANKLNNYVFTAELAQATLI